MKRKILPTEVTVFIIILFPFLTEARSSVPMDRIWTEGNRFVNESGETVIFQGVNLRDPHNLELDGQWTRDHFEEAKHWGAAKSKQVPFFIRFITIEFYMFRIPWVPHPILAMFSLSLGATRHWPESTWWERW